MIAEAKLYDLVQFAAGSRTVLRRLESRLGYLDGMRVLDVGAGTGTYLRAIDNPARYVALDVDASKLDRLTKKRPSAETVIADARHLPFGDDTFDAALCIFVAHHLDDAAFDQMLAEVKRVSARLVLLDPLRNCGVRGRLLWKLDRGAFPRTEPEILSAVRKAFQVDVVERFAVHHAYLLCVAHR